MKLSRPIAAIAAVALMFASQSWAQTPEPQIIKPAPTAPNTPERRPGPTLMIEVTVNRYQGDKRLSSIPYTLTVLPDANVSRLRVGGQIPVPTMTFTPSKESDGTAKAANPLTSYNYRDVGTNIDVTASPAPDGRYRIAVTLEESSVYPSSDGGKSDSQVAGVPAFRSLRANNNVNLKDGQSIEFTAATDRLNGEVTRISLKLTVLN